MYIYRNIFLLITYHLHFELIIVNNDIDYIIMFSLSFNYTYTNISHGAANLFK